MHYFINLCADISLDFISNHKNPERLIWLNEALVLWKEELAMPPGCMWIQLDEWLTSRERCKIMAGFMAFAAARIKQTRPTTEAAMRKECGRVQKLITQFLKPEKDHKERGLP